MKSNKQVGSLSWIRLLLFAVIAGTYTGIMAFLPAAKNTSFADISISFECWILFGVIIIMKSSSALDSGLKCFVFFLISQPLVYLVQIALGSDWSLLGYYRLWIGWTLLTFPMGFIGYYIKKNRWWGMLILAPVMVFVGVHYYGFLNETITWFPHHLLSAIFCAATLLFYPVYMFEDKKIRRAGLILGLVILIAASAAAIRGSHDFYNTNILASYDDGEGKYFDTSYHAALEDASYGDVTIVYDDNLDVCVVSAEFKKPGTTKLILTGPGGEESIYGIEIGKDTYRLFEE